MAIGAPTVGNATAATAAITAINPVTGAGIVAGNLSILAVECKGTSAGVAPTVTPPTDAGVWTLIGTVTNNGTLAAGTDTGSNTVAVYYMVSAPAATAVGDITFTGADNGAAVVITWGNDTGAWDVSATTTGSDTASGANMSITGGAGLDVVTADKVLAVVGISGDIGTLSARAIGGMSGATLSATNGRTNGAVTTSFDSRLSLADVNVNSGSSNAAPTYTHTNASSTTGHARFVRIREVEAPVLPPPALIIPQAAVIRASIF